MYFIQSEVRCGFARQFATLKLTPELDRMTNPVTTILS